MSQKHRVACQVHCPCAACALQGRGGWSLVNWAVVNLAAATLAVGNSAEARHKE